MQEIDTKEVPISHSDLIEILDEEPKGRVARRKKRELRRAEKRKSKLEWVKAIVISLFIALLITTFIKPTSVEGQSMYPTIHDGDYLIINCLQYKLGEPKYGDIVVFKTQIEADAEGKHGKDLIKRVIGLPGDTITIANGAVYRNGTMLDESYLENQSDSGEMADTYVEPGKLFVMGDNRANSLDSRSVEVGQVSQKEILGVAFFRVFPFNSIGLLK